MLLVLLTGLLTSALVVFLLIGVIPWAATASLASAERFKAAADIRTGLISAFVALGAVGTLVYTVRSFHMNQTAQLVNRFESAATQIGEDNPTVSLAGIYAMSQLADVWPDNRQACIDVLCAHVRANIGTVSASVGTRPGGDSRSAVLDVITRHLRPQSRAVRPSWDGLIFDLRGAAIPNADFEGIVLTNGRVLFDGCSIHGRVSFARARVSDATFSFRYCTLEPGGTHEPGGELIFDNAKFYNAAADFSFSNFRGGVVSFRDEVRLAEGARLIFRSVYVRDRARLAFGSEFCGELTFDESHFIGVSKITFDGSTFLEPVSFNKCEFRQEVSLIGVHVQTIVSFKNADFHSGTLVDFSGVTSTLGATIDLTGSNGLGGTVHLAEFPAGQVLGGSGITTAT